MPNELRALSLSLNWKSKENETIEWKVIRIKQQVLNHLEFKGYANKYDNDGNDTEAANKNSFEQTNLN